MTERNFRNFKRKLSRQYGGNSVRRDVFGRRKASAAEIQRELRPNNDFEAQERFYQPTARDIQIKMEGLDE